MPVIECYLVDLWLELMPHNQSLVLFGGKLAVDTLNKTLCCSSSVVAVQL
ncbi:Uncharacterised protein [Vibrio cholerae]|nr:Uncharacterised protein [Vibrio cholerae]